MTTLNTFTNPKTIASAMVDLDRLHGKWKNPVAPCGQYIRALERKWGMNIADLELKVDYRGRRAMEAYGDGIRDGFLLRDGPPPYRAIRLRR